uniref:Thioredoxin-like fold domain-containing protein n=1 Tax=Arcella intermedia TaxID=1963864 RepID=A0A6B2LH52_9EUKA
MTPKIVQTYNALKSAGKAFEVIFATSDNDEHSFKEYYAEMPWLAFPWKDGRIDELSELYEVEGIPTFVVIDTKTWKTITVEGTSAVGTDPTGKDFPWHPKPLNNVDNAGGAINSDPCFIYLDSNLTDATTAHLQQVAESYVNKWNSAGSEHPLKFFWGKSGGLADRIKQFLKIEEDPVLVILNLSDGEYYKQGGAADLKVFSDTAEKFLAHQLTFTKLN